MLKYAIIGTATRATLPMLSTTCCPCIMKSTHTCTPDAKHQTSSNVSMIGWEDCWTLKQAVTSTTRARRPAHVGPATETGTHTCAKQHRVPGQDRDILSLRSDRNMHTCKQATVDAARRATFVATVSTPADSTLSQHPLARILGSTVHRF